MPAGRISSVPDAAGVGESIPEEFIKAVENFRPVSTLSLPQWRAWICSLAFHGLFATGMATITFPPIAHVRTEEPKLLPTTLKIGDKLYFVARIEAKQPARSGTTRGLALPCRWRTSTAFCRAGRKGRTCTRAFWV